MASLRKQFPRDWCESSDFGRDAPYMGTMAPARVLARRLPQDLVRLVAEHGAAMTLQRAARRLRGRRMRARVRRARAAERTERVLRFLSSFALGKTPMTSL